MVDQIRTCWAISAALKSRCDMPAGHSGDHSITVTWGDEQCWSPETDEPIELTVVKPVQEVVEDQPEGCTACTHMHKAGACKCGCYAHI